MDDLDEEYIENNTSDENFSDVGTSKRIRRKTDRSKTKGGKNKGNNAGYSWEDEYHRSWDAVKEDEQGSLAGVIMDLVESRKKRIMRNSTPFQRGIIRTFILIIDMSISMQEKDLRPNRYALTIQYAIEFVTDFFDQNPISQMGILAMRNGVAILISEVGGNPHEHIEKLRSIKRQEAKGSASLQNALEMARGILMHVPSHCTREVLIIFGSLLSLDPGDINKTINALVKERIRVRIIGLAAKVAVCKEIVKKTNSSDETTYSVILNEEHFKDLLTEAVTPLAVVASTDSGYTLVKMGFPTRISEASPSLCSCHSNLTYGGYICPRCKAKVCALPTTCPCCNLMLILSTHLARSYHHLFPLKAFTEVKVRREYKSNHCFACQKPFPDFLKKSSDRDDITSSRYECSTCHKIFCIDCDVFCHEILHNCPGCDSTERNNNKITFLQNGKFTAGNGNENGIENGTGDRNGNDKISKAVKADSGNVTSVV